MAENYDIAFIGFIDGLQRREAIRQQLIETRLSLSPKVAWGVRGVRF